MPDPKPKSDDLRALIEERDRLIAETNRVRDRVKALSQEMTTEQFGVSVGDIVVAPARGRTPAKRHRVTGVSVMTGYRVPWEIVRPWLYGNPERKDGTFGTSVRALYDSWTKED